RHATELRAPRFAFVGERLVRHPALDLELADVADLRTAGLLREALHLRAGAEHDARRIDAEHTRHIDWSVVRDQREQSTALHPQREPRMLESHADAHVVALLFEHADLEARRA